jgi:flavin-binding protein dodecin
MSNHIYKNIELTGTSPVSLDQAIKNAVERAAKTVHNMRWFEVIDTRGHIEEGKVSHWQVSIKVGFTLDEA